MGTSTVVIRPKRTIRMDDEMWKRLQTYASKRGGTCSSVIVGLVYDALEADTPKA